MEQVTEVQASESNQSASERMKRAWATRRANAAAQPRKVRRVTKEDKAADKASVAAAPRRGRPKKVLTTAAVATPTRRQHQYPFYLSRVEYSLEQVRELGALAVTLDGTAYRLLKTEQGPVTASSVTVA